MISINGLSIDGHIDLMNQQLGYVQMGKNVRQKCGLDQWFEMKTYLAIQQIRKRYNPIEDNAGDGSGGDNLGRLKSPIFTSDDVSWSYK